MSKPRDRKSAWHFPPDLAVLLFSDFIFLPFALLAGWLLTHLSKAKTTGDASLLCVAYASGVCGVVLLFLARLSLYRQRRFLVFGPRELDEKHRRLYRWAYRFTGVSVLLMLLLLFILK